MSSKIFKGHNFYKIKVELKYLFSAYLMIALYICPKFLKIFQRFRVIDQTQLGMDRQTDRQLWENQYVVPRTEKS